MSNFDEMERVLDKGIVGMVMELGWNWDGIGMELVKNGNNLVC